MGRKLLVLIRHAKSSWSDQSLSDYERPLNKRGKHDAPFMGQLLRQKGVQPDLFLSSSAKRARKTAKHIAAAIEYPFESIVFNRELYLAGEEKLFDVVAKTDDAVETLFLVGHNYGLTDLADSLTSADIENVPTAGIVGIEIGDSWKDIHPGKATLQFFDYPKKFVRQ